MDPLEPAWGLGFRWPSSRVSSSQKHPNEKTERLLSFAEKTGVNIDPIKTQTMYININNDTPITVDGKPLKRVADFTYLGSIVSSDNAAGKDISTRPGKAQYDFAALIPIWKSKQYSLQTKVRFYNSNVKALLLYGSEVWKVFESDMERLNVFRNRCLRGIRGIFWPEVISNKERYKL